MRVLWGTGSADLTSVGTSQIENLDAFQARSMRAAILVKSATSPPRARLCTSPVLVRGTSSLTQRVELSLVEARPPTGIGDVTSGYSACRQVERDISPLGLERAESQAQLADDLRVHVQGVAGPVPFLIREGRPIGRQRDVIQRCSSS